MRIAIYLLVVISAARIAVGQAPEQRGDTFSHRTIDPARNFGRNLRLPAGLPSALRHELIQRLAQGTLSQGRSHGYRTGTRRRGR